MTNPTPRTASLVRSTRETQIELTLDLDPPSGAASTIDTGIGFLDHMLNSLAKHAQITISLTCKGDLEVDDHHTAEDCALALGEALDRCLGERRGVRRFGSAYAPLDEALARSVVDLSGRPWPEVRLDLHRESIGGIACENLTHWFNSFAIASRTTLHVDVLRGANDHHKVEAAFKATALALRQAIERSARASDEILSTKGVL